MNTGALIDAKIPNTVKPPYSRRSSDFSKVSTTVESSSPIHVRTSVSGMFDDVHVDLMSDVQMSFVSNFQKNQMFTL
jgi:hypothetical protein